MTCRDYRVETAECFLSLLHLETSIKTKPEKLRKRFHFASDYTGMTSPDVPRQTCPGERALRRPVTMFASICWLYGSYFRKVPAVGAEGGRFPGTDKGALSKMTVMSCASPSARTKQSRSFPLGLLSRAQSHREKTKTNGCHSGNGLIVSGRP